MKSDIFNVITIQLNKRIKEHIIKIKKKINNQLNRKKEFNERERKKPDYVKINI